MSSGISNTMNTPIEILEASFPVRVDRYEIVPDSGGAGKWRGGSGVLRVWKVVGNPSQVSVCCERTKSPPFGLVGGRAGLGARVAVAGPDGIQHELNSKGSFSVPPSCEVWLRAPGSGGYGPPSERDRARVRDDVINGYVTPESAASDYGVRDPTSVACAACERTPRPRPPRR